MTFLAYFCEPIPQKGAVNIVRRKIYALLRRAVPSIREQHRLDSLIGPIGYWKEIQAYQLKFLVRMGMKPHQSLLDIGCGPLSGRLAFIRYLDSGKYFGLDVNGDSIVEAHKQVQKHGLSLKKPTLICCSDFGREALSGRHFDFVWASQILYHLTEDQIRSLLSQLGRCMTERSRFFGDIIGHHHHVKPNSHWRGFSFHLHDSATLSKMADTFGLRISTLGQIAEFGYPNSLGLKTNEMVEIIKK